MAEARENTDAIDTAQRRAVIFLVHGVGLPCADVFGQNLTERLRELPFHGEFHVERISWHESVEPPVGPGGFVNERQLTGLMQGLIGASARVPNSSRRVHRFLSAVMLFAPLWLYLLLVCLFGAVNTQAVGDTRYAILRQVGHLVGQIICEFCPGFLVRHAPSIVIVYGVVLAVVMCIQFVVCSSCDGLLHAVRVCSLALIRPIVMFVSSWVLVPSAILLIAASLTILFNGVIGRKTPDTIPVELHAQFGYIPVLGLDEVYKESVLMAAMYGCFFAAFFIVRWCTIGLRWILKVVADVVCFMGNKEYAAALETLVANRIAKVSFREGDRVILVGHSLGSAILLSCLLQSRFAFPEGATLTVVTMGSPIRRLLSRFFRGIYPTADEAFHACTALHGNFSWINIYRPWDPIGAQLFLSQSQRQRDYSTRQWRKFGFAAHCGYWDDPVVHRVAYKFIAGVGHEAGSGGQPIPPGVAVRTDWSSVDNSFAFHRTIGVNVCLIAGVALGLVSGWESACRFAAVDMGPGDPRAIRKVIANAKPGTVEQGFGDLFRVEEHISSGGEGGTGPQSRTDYVVVFQPSEAQMPIAVRYRAMDFRLEVPKGAEEECAIKRWRYYEQCWKRKVAIRYLKQDPSNVDFPEFQAPKRFSGKNIIVAVAEWVSTVLILIFTVGVFVFVFVCITFLCVFASCIYCGVQVADSDPKPRAVN